MLSFSPYNKARPHDWSSKQLPFNSSSIRYNITMPPYKGCLKNLKINADFKTAAKQVGVSKGCPKDSLVGPIISVLYPSRPKLGPADTILPTAVQASRRAELSLGSRLAADLADLSLSDQVHVSVGFKSAQSQGLILQDRQQVSSNVPFRNIRFVFHRSQVLTLLLPYFCRQTGSTLVWKTATWFAAPTKMCGSPTKSTTMTCGIM